MGAVFFLVIGMIAVGVIGLIAYVVAKQIHDKSTEDFEQRDN